VKPGKAARAIVYYRRTGQHALAHYLEDQLAKAGRCRICGARLTDEDSIRRGIGPTCWAKRERVSPMGVTENTS
jgi:hypothetical protein